MKKDKIGIIFCMFGNQDFVEPCLNAWKQVKNEFFVYSCVSAPFEGYEDLKVETDNTAELIRAANIMDFHFITDKYIKETDARQKCLDYLKEQNCDTVFLVDIDEFYTVEEVNKILEYVDKNKDVAWFKISFRNFFQNKNQFLSEYFCPPRIYRVNFLPFKLHSFIEDNGISYLANNNIIHPSCLRNKTIEIGVSHYSWLSNTGTKNKILYQNQRWSSERKSSLNGDGCSYKWNEEQNCVEFNEIWYKKNKLEIPNLNFL